ncbi:MAG: amidohydrolase [Candidatus Zophobacter franzmannii]|nr:amidohydrolase [Candidatus Zophobacter franzmannii]
MDLVKVRQDLHRIPELAFNEYKTTDYIYNLLKDYSDLELIKVNPTGLIAVYKGGTGDYVLFRSDIDALPLKEQTDCNFHSEHEGTMHACGHDIHMTVLLGFIHEVCTTKPKKNLLFLFQPAEEGKGGAEHILRSKVLDQWPIKTALALHCSPDYHVGEVATKGGIFFGIPEEFIVEFHGRNAHAAFPHKGIDAIYAGVQFYNLMQSQITKRFSSTDPVIFHIGKFEGGDAENILASKCLLQGTHRTLTPENHRAMNELILSTGKAVAAVTGAEFKFREVSVYEAVNNDQFVYNNFKKTIENLDDIKFIEAESVMTGEDFGFFTTLYPSLLFWLGTGLSEHGLHSPYYLPDQEAVETGIRVYMALLERM